MIDIKMSNDVCLLNGATTPVDGGSGTGAGLAGKGSQYTARDTGVVYLNTGTKAVPVWTVLGAGTLTLGTVITGFVSGAGVVAASDTILQAVDKLDGNQIAGSTSAAITGKVLTGLGAGSNTTILSTDTILAALAKLQAQITALV